MVDLQFLKLGLVGLWAGWFSLVVLSNVCDALKQAGALPAGWRFVSGNLKQVREAVSVYRCPAGCAALLFGGVVLWEALAAALLWRALVLSVAGPGLALGAVNLAFTCALGLWAAFLLAEEVFRQYRTESKHLLFFIAQLLSLAALHWLPE